MLFRSDGSLNAAILALQFLAVADATIADKLATYKEGLKNKIVKANEDLKQISYTYKVN